jgi:hypothetical protein
MLVKHRVETQRKNANFNAFDCYQVVGHCSNVKPLLLVSASCTRVLCPYGAVRGASGGLAEVPWESGVKWICSTKPTTTRP